MGHLYTKMKIFHYKDKIDSLPREADTTLPPVHIRIKPTNLCNHKCYYCAYRSEGLQLGKDMAVRDFIPHKKMMEIIDDVIEMGIKAVTFSGGGEPFCYPYLLDVIKKLAQAPVKFAALTNGVLVKGQIAEFFAHQGTWLRVSIDGWDGASYAEYRGVSENEFEKVIRNIRDFKRYEGDCYLGASIIVDKKNAGHIYELINILQNTGLDSIKISPCIVSNSGRDNNEYHKSIVSTVKEQIAKAENVFGNGPAEIFDAYHEQLDSFEKPYRWCPYLQILPVIGADQNIYPCQDKAYNLDEGLLGSIKDKRFKNFWFLDKNKFFKIDPSVHCNHHCVADAKNGLIFDYLNANKEHLAFV